MLGRLQAGGPSLLFLAAWLLALPLVPGAEPDLISEKSIAELKTLVDSPKEESSAARKRLATKRAIRTSEELIGAHPEAANRFEVLGVLFRAQQSMLALDDSRENREALIETSRKLALAPDEYAEIRLDADLLLSQVEAARRGADGKARVHALEPLLTRYRDTPAESRILRIATLLALEIGDHRLIEDLRKTMAVRFARDPEMIDFLRREFGGQIFGIPFCGMFETADGQQISFPMHGLGRTTLLYFWSNDGPGAEGLGRLATAWKERRQELDGRIQIVSLNLDELPDAGTALLRAAGVDWPALRLPGGRAHPAYRAFCVRDPGIVTVTSTGYAALTMPGATRASLNSGAVPDYVRMFGSLIAREWTEPAYLALLVSLLAGEPFVVPVVGPFDPSRPPEFVAVAADGKSIPRTPACVPEETLLAIQQCFTAPPRRYRLPIAEARSNYDKAAELCRTAIADHSGAPDLWIVRNRLIVSLLGLWKVTADPGYLKEAIDESKAAIAGGGFPAGTDVVPRLCIAREAFEKSNHDPEAVITEFVKATGGDDASGPALVGAIILALESGDRGAYEEYRRAILAQHTENPMMWTAVSYLLDRHCQYQVCLPPISGGRIPPRRAEYFLSEVTADEARRTLQTVLTPLDGGSFRIPEDALGKWTVILFATPWSKEGPPSPERIAGDLSGYASRRPAEDVTVVLAVLDDDADKVRSLVTAKPLPCPVMMVPGGIENVLVQRLGIMAEDKSLNAVVLRPDGSIATVISGLTSRHSNGGGPAIQNVIEWHDDRAVIAALEQGNVEQAQRLAFSLAPLPDPAVGAPKGGKPTPQPMSLPHLRARARVYKALEEWDKALADAEDLVARETEISGLISVRTAALNEAEALRDQVRRRGQQPSD